MKKYKHISKKKLKSRISELENIINPCDIFGTCFLTSTNSTPNKNRVDRIDDTIDKLETKVKLLLQKDNLEYVEITEKNGETKEYAKLRKKTKKSKKLK